MHSKWILRIYVETEEKEMTFPFKNAGPRIVQLYNLVSHRQSKKIPAGILNISQRQGSCLLNWVK